MFIIADEQTFRIRGQSRLASAGKTKEDCRVLAFLIRVGRAMHGSDALERQEVVHHGEHTLLYLTAVPGVDDDLLAARKVERCNRLGIQAEFLIVRDFSLGSIVDNEIRLKINQFICRRVDEHIGYKMCLPCNFNDEADSHARILVCATESIDYIEFLVGELFLGDFLQCSPSFRRCRMVIIFVFIGSPPYSVFRSLVLNNEFVLRGTASVNTCHDIYCTELSELTLLISFKTCLCFFIKQRLIRRVVQNLSSTCDAVLTQINVSHVFFNLFQYDNFDRNIPHIYVTINRFSKRL